jgi:hypothetical protein
LVLVLAVSVSELALISRCERLRNHEKSRRSSTTALSSEDSEEETGVVVVVVVVEGSAAALELELPAALELELPAELELEPPALVEIISYRTATDAELQFDNVESSMKSTGGSAGSGSGSST